MVCNDTIIYELDEEIVELNEQIVKLECVVESQKEQINDLTGRLSVTYIKPASIDNKLWLNYDSEINEVDKLEQKYDFIKDSVDLLYHSILDGCVGLTHEQEQARIDTIHQEIYQKRILMEIAKQEFEKAYWGEWELKVEKTHVKSTLKA